MHSPFWRSPALMKKFTFTSYSATKMCSELASHSWSICVTLKIHSIPYFHFKLSMISRQEWGVNKCEVFVPITYYLHIIINITALCLPTEKEISSHFHWQHWLSFSFENVQLWISLWIYRGLSVSRLTDNYLKTNSVELLQLSKNTRVKSVNSCLWYGINCYIRIS